MKMYDNIKDLKEQLDKQGITNDFYDDFMWDEQQIYIFTNGGEYSVVTYPKIYPKLEIQDTLNYAKTSRLTDAKTIIEFLTRKTALELAVQGG